MVLRRITLFLEDKASLAYTICQRKLLRKIIKQELIKRRKLLDAANKTEKQLNNWKLKFLLRPVPEISCLDLFTNIGFSRCFGLKHDILLDRKFISIQGGALKGTGPTNAQINCTEMWLSISI